MDILDLVFTRSIQQLPLNCCPFFIPCQCILFITAKEVPWGFQSDHDPLHMAPMAHHQASPSSDSPKPLKVRSPESTSVQLSLHSFLIPLHSGWPSLFLRHTDQMPALGFLHLFPLPSMAFCVYCVHDSLTHIFQTFIQCGLFSAFPKIFKSIPLFSFIFLFLVLLWLMLLIILFCIADSHSGMQVPWKQWLSSAFYPAETSAAVAVIYPLTGHIW